MNACLYCNEIIFDDSAFCGKCGKEQVRFFRSHRFYSHVLTGLLVLSILGSALQFSIVLILSSFRRSFGNDHADEYIGFSIAVCAIGTLIGSIIMAFRKKVGLFIYSIFQFLTVIGLTIFMSGDYRNLSFIDGELLFIIFPFLLFLITYWLNPIRRLFK
ncbi:MAG: hypothetical protein AAF487_12830 [Bacteroidota bacterium]